MTAAVSVAIGLGQFTVGFMGAILAWIVLAWMLRLEHRSEKSKGTSPKEDSLKEDESES